MKFTILVIILATATAHLILAENAEHPDPDPREKEQDPSLLQSREPMPDKIGLSIDLPNIVQSIKPISQSKQLKKIKWNRGMFAKAVGNLGILKIPGLKLVKMGKNFIHTLEKVKGQMIKIRAKARPRDISIHGNKQDTSQKKSLHDLCQEYVDSIYVLAHADERLAYRLETVRCEGSCFSVTLNMILGECVLKSKTMVVYILDSSNNLFPKSVNAGCACECLTNFL